MRLRRQQQLDTYMFLPIQPPAQRMEIIYAEKKNEIYANTVNDHWIRKTPSSYLWVKADPWNVQLVPISLLCSGNQKIHILTYREIFVILN